MDLKDRLIKRGFPKGFVPLDQCAFYPVTYSFSDQNDTAEIVRKRKGNCTFSVDEDAKVNYGACDQRFWVLNLFDDIAYLVEMRPLVVGMSGRHDDYTALRCALSVAHRYLKLGGSAYVLDAANPQRVLRKNNVSASIPRLIVIHNLGTKCAARNLTNTQNLLRKFQDCLRIVVSSGSNPRVFFKKHLQYHIDEGIYFG